MTNDYFVVTLNAASSWIAENCHTYALSSAIDRLSSEYDDVYLSVESSIVSYIELSGFIDLHLADIADEMDSVKSFLNARISDRTQYLQTALENFRSQAS